LPSVTATRNPHRPNPVRRGGVGGTVVAGRRSPVSLIGKVIAVLDALTVADRLGGIARHAGLPTATVHRTLRELIRLGWVRAEGEAYRCSYHLSLRLAHLRQAGHHRANHRRANR
jgi:DNA-binding IclR family transcriptional regulator